MNRDLLCEAKKTKSVEELIALLEKNNISITREEASVYFNKLNSKKGEVNDDELDSVSGGGCKQSSPSYSSPTENRLSIGKTVWLKNEGHCSGAASFYKPSTLCINPVCGSRIFHIVKQVDNTKYLIACHNCAWTYCAEERNIVS